MCGRCAWAAQEAVWSARLCSALRVVAFRKGCAYKCHGMGWVAQMLLAHRCGAGEACRALSLRRVVVLVSAVQGFWWESVFVVGKSWPCAWTVCYVSFMVSF